MYAHKVLFDAYYSCCVLESLYLTFVVLLVVYFAKAVARFCLANCSKVLRYSLSFACFVAFINYLRFQLKLSTR